MNKTLTATAVALAAAAIVVAGCGKTTSAAGTSNPAPAAAASSVMANPTASADLNQAKALVAKCIPGTPLQQVHTVHLLVASKTGPDAQAGEQTRTKVYDCMGVPADQRDNFTNAALTDAEHGHLGTAAGRHTYFGVTLPQLLATYQAKP